MTLELDGLTHQDVPDALRLSTEAGWNQTAADWSRLLDLAPGACFAGRLAGHLVATATVVSYGETVRIASDAGEASPESIAGGLGHSQGPKYNWIGMVIVERACRGRGFGSELLRRALEYGLGQGDGTVGLDATDLGRPVYLGHGFVDSAPIDRWLGQLTPGGSPGSPKVETLIGRIPDEALAFDRSAAGLDRGALLRHLGQEPGVSVLVARDQQRPVGLAFLRPGREHHHLGPVIAEGGDGLQALLHAAAERLAGQTVLMDALRNELTCESTGRLWPSRPASPAAHDIRAAAGHSDREPRRRGHGFRMGLIAPITSEEQLDDVLSEPPAAVIDSFRRLEGDVLILGAGGKMGPTLARMAVRAATEAGRETRIYAASRFAERAVRDRLRSWGVTALVCDLAEPDAIARLPHCSNLLYLVGRKFGSSGSEWETWASNVHLASEIARSFPRARIVAFSTGNVYPLWPVASETAEALPAGPDEESPVGPVGEYAQSCLGRERMLEYFSRRNDTPVTLLRINYAVELRYGVLVDIATKIWTGEPVGLHMGYANVIWQADAHAYALRSLEICSAPPVVLNVTGPTVRIRDLAEGLARRMDRTVRFSGVEGPTALLSNPARCHARFGAPAVSLDRMLDWVAHWVRHDGATLGKPTRFEVRDGSF